jgi:hypothetical protein
VGPEAYRPGAGRETPARGRKKGGGA